MYKKITLDNGVTLVTNNMPHMESLAIGIWIKTGSRNEEKDHCGISHFLEHMIFKGTDTRSCRKLKEDIEGRGGSLNGFTSEEVSCFLAKVNIKHLGIALDVLSDMVLNASIAEKDVERERTVIMEEIKMYQDLPNHHVHDMLADLMWPEHPLGRPIAGNIDSVANISRNDITGYKKAKYAPENISIVLCGNLDHNAAVSRIKDIFRSKIKLEAWPFSAFKNSQSGPRINVLYKDTEQAHLCMGLHSFGRMHKDRFALGLLHIILGANMSSRLFENIREKKGLAYEIGTEIKRYRETGAFIVHAGMEHRKANDVIRVILEELKKIKCEKVSGSELKRAKEFFRVQLLMALEDTVEHMLWLGDYVTTLNKLPDREKIINKVVAVTVSDIKRVAGSIFKGSNLNIALIGALKDKEQKEIEKELIL